MRDRIEERRTDRLRPEVRSTTKARAHVRRDAEHNRFCVTDAPERLAEAGVDLGRALRTVEALLQELLLRPSRGHEVEPTAGRAKQKRELFDRHHRIVTIAWAMVTRTEGAFRRTSRRSWI